MAAIVFFAVLTIACADDILANDFHIPFERLIEILQYSVLIGPVVGFVIAYKACQALQRTHAHPIQRPIGGIIIRTSDGAYHTLAEHARERPRRRHGENGHGENGHGADGRPWRRSAPAPTVTKPAPVGAADDARRPFRLAGDWGGRSRPARPGWRVTAGPPPRAPTLVCGAPAEPAGWRRRSNAVPRGPLVRSGPRAEKAGGWGRTQGRGAPPAPLLVAALPFTPVRAGPRSVVVLGVGIQVTRMPGRGGGLLFLLGVGHFDLGFGLGDPPDHGPEEQDAGGDQVHSCRRSGRATPKIKPSPIPAGQIEAEGK